MDTTGGSGSLLKWQDYLIIAIVLAISAAIGIYYRFTGGRQRTAEEYFSADRSIGIVLLAVASMVSITSAITLLGISAENYAYGTQFTVLYLGIPACLPLIMYFYFPVFYRLRTMSVYEYLERRFGVTARLFASTANFLQLLLYSGIVLFAPSIALEATTGLSGMLSVLLMGTICTFYSTIGGIKAVLITDMLQAALMFASMLCVLYTAARDLDGGLADVWTFAVESDRIHFFDFRLDPTIRHTSWGLLFGGMATFLSFCGVSQVQVQRLLTAKSLKSSRMALVLTGPLIVALGLITSYSGLALYAVYRNCDPVRAGKISTTDQLLPYFSVDKMSWAPGLTGLFIAGVFSASLSSISAILNSLAAVAIEDYVKPVYARLGFQFPEERTALVGKIFAILNGVTCLCIAFIARKFGTLTEAGLGITGSLTGPILGIFTLGMFVESANEFGAVAGIVTALVTTTWIAFGSPKYTTPPLPQSIDGCDNATLASIPDNSTLWWYRDTYTDKPPFYLYRISYIWYCPLGLAISVLVGYVASFAGRRFYKNAPEPDPNLFVPFLKSRMERRRRDAAKTAGSQVFVLEPTRK